MSSALLTLAKKRLSDLAGLYEARYAAMRRYLEKNGSSRSGCEVVPAEIRMYIKTAD